MFGKILLVSFALLFAGCADKNYAKDVEASVSSAQGIENCNLFFRELQLCADFNWEVKPTESEMGSLILRFWSADDLSSHPVLARPDTNLKVILWMPTMGHGSSPVAIQNLATGVYRVDRIFFNMRGDWEIRFQMKIGDRTVDEFFYKLAF